MRTLLQCHANLTVAKHRILIVKLGALGDAIMASAVVPAARRRWPSAHITWVAGRGIRPLVERFEGVDTVIEVDDHALLLGGPLARAAGLISCWRRIGRGYDLAIIAHADWRYAALAWWCGAGDVRRAPLGRRTSTARWHGDVYAMLAAPPTAAGPVERGAQYAGVRADPRPRAPQVAGTGPLVVISPGGARNALRDDALRRWPVDRWIALTTRLVAAGVRVVAVGTPEDCAETARCATAGALDLGGATDLPALFALIQGADAVITHDSGVLHMALLAQRPVVALFGPTPSAYFVPAGARARILSSGAGLACAPCYDGVGFAPCARNACLADVEVLTVDQAVHSYLPSPGRPTS